MSEDLRSCDRPLDQRSNVPTNIPLERVKSDPTTWLRRKWPRSESRLRRRLAAVRYYNLAWLAWQAGDRLLGEMTYRVASEIDSGKVPIVKKLPSALLSRCFSRST
jgi:hypothetical protein